MHDPSPNVMKRYVTMPTPTEPEDPAWRIVITEWALDSYLTLRHAQAFTDNEYWNTLRPDVELLRTGIPSPNPKFDNPKFWGPAKLGPNVLPNGYKMKWHQCGPGLVQIRLPVMAGNQEAFLCEAYVKANEVVDQRKMARFKSHMNLITMGRFVFRGAL